MITFRNVSKRFPDGTVAVDRLTREVPTCAISALLTEFPRAHGLD